MDPMDPMDKYLVIAKYYLSIGSIFFFILIKKKMDKYLVIAKYLSLGSIRSIFFI
jgi:hypothetical protein